MTISRRRLLLGTVGGALLGLGGCAKESTVDGSSSGSVPSAAPSASPSPSSAATRIVALGQGPDADTLLAMGILPVGMSAAFTTGDYYPWTKEKLAGRTSALLQIGETVPYEQIAALHPDLIVATTSYLAADGLSKLEGIAKVLAPVTSADKETWQSTVVRIGDVLGRGGEARELVAKTEAGLKAVQDAHPAWAGKTFTFNPVFPGMEQYTVSSTADVSAGLLAELGLSLDPDVTVLPQSDVAGRSIVSKEKLSILDADAVLMSYFGGGQTEMEADPLYQALPAVKRGSAVVLDPDAAIGLAFPSVLSIPYAIERIVPQLEKALAAM
jgi:iron complex transport system substrate-binding protein